MAIKLSLQPNPTQPGKWRVVLHPGRAYDFEQFLDHVERSSTISRTDALAVLTAAAGWVERRAEEGREADLGPLGRSRLGMRGSFDALPERIMDEDVELTLGWILPRALKRRVARHGAALARKHVAPTPKAPAPREARRILDNADLDPLPARYVPGRPMRVMGHRLDFDPTLPGEGLFLTDDTGTESPVALIFLNEPSQLVFMMPETATGPQRLTLRHHHPRPHGPLLEGSLPAILQPADEE